MWVATRAFLLNDVPLKSMVVQTHGEWPETLTPEAFAQSLTNALGACIPSTSSNELEAAPTKNARSLAIKLNLPLNQSELESSLRALAAIFQQERVDTIQDVVVTGRFVDTSSWEASMRFVEA